MKILSAKQIRAIDDYTIAHEPVSPEALMDRAAAAFTQWFVQRFHPHSRVVIACGPGNNGGDGKVIGKKLLGKGYQVDVFDTFDSLPDFSPYDIIIDGLFGSGLNRPVAGRYGAVIDAINTADRTVVAIDIPSGLMADEHHSAGAIVKASHTLSFQFPKLAFMLPQNDRYVGQWHLADIGLHEEGVSQQETPHYLLTAEKVGAMLKPRPKFSHKGTYGHALLIAGSYGKMGAAILSGRAAMRSGLGLLTLYIPRCGVSPTQAALPEAMVVADPSEENISLPPAYEKYDAIGMGPGVGQQEGTKQVLETLLLANSCPMVLDADALNVLSGHPAMFEILPPDTILTPHPKEFQRLAGEWTNDFERLQKQRAFSRKYRVIIVLKGAHTSISLPSGDIFFNTTGGPGMATGGSGDVLTGMITALVAQHYLPATAAQVGVYLHGLAGDMAAIEKGAVSLIASDIIRGIPAAFKKII